MKEVIKAHAQLLVKMLYALVVVLIIKYSFNPDRFYLGAFYMAITFTRMDKAADLTWEYFAKKFKNRFG